jgi:hypothetical protein
MTVHEFKAKQNVIQSTGPVDGGGEPPYDDGMEARVTKLEAAAQDTRDRLVRIETRLDSIATKEDMHRELHSLTWKMISAQAALVAAVYFVAKFIH